ncbi:suppressor of fused domain protein [Corynebacterium heidelbergense]|nr:suppressor of fused domain protein [Corynebacterium heidelbergense]WCZ36109.1 Suppressor of fused protein (SUFU) [Corynebacterium heidelbergense]
MSDQETTEGGQSVYHYHSLETREAGQQPKRAFRQGFENHLARFFDPNKVRVWHKLPSELIHVDVYMAAATPERPFGTLITSGMSDMPMTLPDTVDEQVRFSDERAELVMRLPSSWPLDQDALEDPVNYWPIQWMKTLAQLPHAYSTWLGNGHSIPNGQPADTYPGTNFDGVVLGAPVDLPVEFGSYEVDGTPVSLYGLFPAYEEEM